MVFKSLSIACLILIGSVTAARADTFVFTDRAAFQRAAFPNIALRISNFFTQDSGHNFVTYSNILTVVYDFRGLIGVECISIGCEAKIPHGGEPLFNSDVVVGPFSVPVYAISYEIVGRFKLNGINVNATTPAFFGFIFDQPTTALPLPEIALLPNPPGLPIPGRYFITNIRVRTTPKPVPPSPKQLLSELVSDVIAMNLRAGVANSLDAKLSAAIAALDDEKPANEFATINALWAFINAVHAQRGHELTNDEADSLVRSAEAIISLISP